MATKSYISPDGAVRTSDYRSGRFEIGRIRFPFHSQAWERENLSGPGCGLVFPTLPYRLTLMKTGIETIVLPPTVLFTNGMDPIARRPVTPQGLLSDFVEISRVLAIEIVSEFDSAQSDTGKPFRFLEGTLPPALVLQVSALLRSTRSSNDPDPLYVEESILNIVQAALHVSYSARGHKLRHRKRPLRKKQIDIVADVIHRLTTQSARPASLQELASSVDLSAAYLCRVFRGVTGQTIHEFLTHQRLRLALNQLADAIDLTAVAVSSGFYDAPQFTRTFRREFGVTPSRARQALRNGHGINDITIRKASRTPITAPCN